MRALRMDSVQLSLRAALAAGLAFWAATFFRSEFAIYALVAAVIVTDLSPETTRNLAWQRLAGTLVGATTGALMVYVMPTGPIAIGVGILLAMLLTFLLRLDAAAKIAGYVAGIVLLMHDDNPWLYAFMRAWDTILGIASALLVSYLPKLVRNADPP